MPAKLIFVLVWGYLTTSVYHPLYIPGTFWFGRFDVDGKMVQFEERTERNPSLSKFECDKSTFGERSISVQSRREGESIAKAMARPVKCVFYSMPQALFHRAGWYDEDMGHFPQQKSRSKFEDPGAPKYKYPLFKGPAGSRAGRSATIKRVGYKLAVEICDNGIDDDGDGLIDLNDSDCVCQTQPISHIPNPSFEEITCCPSGNSQLDCAGTWIQASEATTDYYNRCGYFVRDRFPVPLPIPDGNAYIGFRNGRFSNRSPGNNPDNNSDNSNPNWKEYTGACLLAPLEAGTQYTFQFYIGFVSQSISPPMSVVLYGTTDCKNLPFGVGDREFGCPTNGPGWEVLGQVYVSGTSNWRQYKITTTPREEITAIAIGPDCTELDLSVNPYYFLDNLILADSELFGPNIQTAGHPCSPDFSLVASEKQNAHYQWYRDGIAVVGAVKRELNISDQEGVYQVMVTLKSNCVLSDPYEYTIPTFNTVARKVVCPEETYRFGDDLLNRSGIYINNFQSQEGCDSLVELELIILTEKIDSVTDWFFKGDEYRLGPYNFHSPGTANLTLASSIGCDSLVHLTLKEYELYIPNAFTPNGDGVNDDFTVYGSEDLIDIQSMRIFDRWGNRVYEQLKEYPFRWDGTKDGQEMDDGVYAYLLDLVLFDGTKKVLSGDITIMR